MSRALTIRNFTRPAYVPIQNKNIATRLNKNVFPKYVETTNCNGFGDVELIHIQHNYTDSKDIIKVTNVLTNLFKDCLILLRNGVYTVFTKNRDFQEEIENISEHIPYERLTEIYRSSRTYAVYRNQDGIKCVLPESPCSYSSSVFTKLANVENRKSSVVSIAIEKLYRKHTERNIKASVTEVLHCKYKPACQTREVNISLCQSREINQHDQEKVVLPRERHQPLENPLPDPVSPSRVFCTCPILETVQNPFNVPVQYFNEILPSPALDTTDVQDLASAVPAQDPAQVQYTRYREYTDRLTTYKGWGKNKPEPKYLSQAGFFFTGTGDLVRCFSCGLGLKDFTVDIIPIKEHVRHSDLCSFLPELLSDEQFAHLKKELRAKDPEYNRRTQHRESNGKYRHPGYETIEARLSSFSKWPLKLCHHLIAETGLYYTGFEAVVRCFACDGGFRKLKSTDDLWLDHCFYFPSCPYMQKRIGERFIKLVQETVCGIEEEEEKEKGAVGGSNFRERSGQIVPENRDYLRKQCLEMGFQKSDIEDALQKLIKRGYSHNIGPVLDLLEENKTKGESPLREKLEAKLPDYRQEENESLRKLVYCETCKEKANALFLPCKHHRYCMICSAQYEICPICKTNIMKKEKTYR